MATFGGKKGFCNCFFLFLFFCFFIIVTYCPVLTKCCTFSYIFAFCQNKSGSHFNVCLCRFLETHVDDHGGTTREGGLDSSEKTTPPRDDCKTGHPPTANTGKQKPSHRIKAASPSNNGSIPSNHNSSPSNQSSGPSNHRSTPDNHNSLHGNNNSAPSNQDSRSSIQSNQISRGSTPSPKGPEELREIIDRLTKDHKPTREVLYLQQQVYQVCQKISCFVTFLK